MTMTPEQSRWAVVYDACRAYERRGQPVPEDLAKREAELSDAALFSTLPNGGDRRAQPDLNPYDFRAFIGALLFLVLFVLALGVAGWIEAAL